MRLQALLPLLIHRETPRTALVIGLGTGITGGALLTWPGLEHRAVAELLPAVVRAAPQFKGNYSMSTDARIGYMPTRVWGCPTTAMWVYRLGPERAKRMLFTGDKITGIEAEKLGLVLKAVPPERLDAEVEALAERMASVPVNQLMMQKLMINQAVEAMGLKTTQLIATVFDGITRHSPEGVNFKRRAVAVGWKEAVRDRDAGTWDWTENRPIDDLRR